MRHAFAVAVVIAPPSLHSLNAADLDAFISRVVVDQHAIGVTVGVMQNGKVVLAKGYGVSNSATKTRVTPDGKVQEFLFNRR